MAVTTVVLGPAGRSRRRTTRYYECTDSGTYNIAGDPIDLTAATDPSNTNHPVAGLFDPIAFTQLFSLVFNGDSSYDTGIASPGTITATPSTTGGTLAAGTYYYVVTALNAQGETAGSPEVSAVTTGATGSVALTWAAVTGATSYKVYRGTAAGAESVYYTTATNSYTDTNAASTAGTVPAASTATSGRYDIVVKKNPAASSWQNAVIVLLNNSANGSALPTGTLANSFTFALEVSGPSGTF